MRRDTMTLMKRFLYLSKINREKALRETEGENNDFNTSSRIEKQETMSLASGIHHEKMTAEERQLYLRKINREKALRETEGENNDFNTSSRIENQETKSLAAGINRKKMTAEER